MMKIKNIIKGLMLTLQLFSVMPRLMATENDPTDDPEFEELLKERLEESNDPVTPSKQEESIKKEQPVKKIEETPLSEEEKKKISEDIKELQQEAEEKKKKEEEEKRKKLEIKPIEDIKHKIEKKEEKKEEIKIPQPQKPFLQVIDELQKMLNQIDSKGKKTILKSIEKYNKNLQYIIKYPHKSTDKQAQKASESLKKITEKIELIKKDIKLKLEENKQNIIIASTPEAKEIAEKKINLDQEIKEYESLIKSTKKQLIGKQKEIKTLQETITKIEKKKPEESFLSRVGSFIIPEETELDKAKKRMPDLTKQISLIQNQINLYTKKATIYQQLKVLENTNAMLNEFLTKKTEAFTQAQEEFNKLKESINQLLSANIKARTQILIIDLDTQIKKYEKESVVQIQEKILEPLKKALQEAQILLKGQEKFDKDQIKTQADTLLKITEDIKPLQTNIEQFIKTENEKVQQEKIKKEEQETLKQKEEKGKETIKKQTEQEAKEKLEATKKLEELQKEETVDQEKLKKIGEQIKQLENEKPLEKNSFLKAYETLQRVQKSIPKKYKSIEKYIKKAMAIENEFYATQKLPEIKEQIEKISKEIETQLGLEKTKKDLILAQKLAKKTEATIPGPEKILKLYNQKKGTLEPLLTNKLNQLRPLETLEKYKQQKGFFAGIGQQIGITETEVEKTKKDVEGIKKKIETCATKIVIYETLTRLEGEATKINNYIKNTIQPIFEKFQEVKNNIKKLQDQNLKEKAEALINVINKNIEKYEAIKEQGEETTKRINELKSELEIVKNFAKTLQTQTYKELDKNLNTLTQFTKKFESLQQSVEEDLKKEQVRKEEIEKYWKLFDTQTFLTQLHDIILKIDEYKQDLPTAKQTSPFITTKHLDSIKEILENTMLEIYNNFYTFSPLNLCIYPPKHPDDEYYDDMKEATYTVKNISFKNLSLSRGKTYSQISLKSNLYLGKPNIYAVTIICRTFPPEIATIEIIQKNKKNTIILKNKSLKNDPTLIDRSEKIISTKHVDHEKPQALVFVLDNNKKYIYSTLETWKHWMFPAAPPTPTKLTYAVKQGQHNINITPQPEHTLMQTFPRQITTIKTTLKQTREGQTLDKKIFEEAITEITKFLDDALKMKLENIQTLGGNEPEAFNYYATIGIYEIYFTAETPFKKNIVTVVPKYSTQSPKKILHARFNLSFADNQYSLAEASIGYISAEGKPQTIIIKKENNKFIAKPKSTGIIETGWQQIKDLGELLFSKFIK